MKPLLALGLAAVGGAVAFRCLPSRMRDRLTAGVDRRITRKMEHMLANLPEGSPPRLIMSVLPELQVQNRQIIAMLQEQNDLLRSLRPYAE